MPLLRIETIGAGVRLGLWRIDESVDGFCMADERLRPIAALVSRHRSHSRQLEIMAVYALLFSMTGDERLRIAHDERSRPLVEGYHVGISHTRGFAALILSTAQKVSVDIEYVSPRVARVVSKFVRADEQAPNLPSLLVHWCVKETLYKLFSDEDLQYFEMRVRPFELQASGMVKADDLKIAKTQAVNYRITADYVLTYAIS